MMEQPDSDIAPNAYIANEGSIAVKIHITPKQVLDNETLTLEIAFTPYSSKFFLPQFSYASPKVTVKMHRIIVIEEAAAEGP